MTSKGGADPIRVLVVDDSPFARVTITKMLEHDPAIRVIGTASNGEEALRKLMSESPDVLTLDLEMPVLDGFAVLRWLIANRPTPVVVVSSKHAREDVFRALELGAIDFVVKPQPKASPEFSILEMDLREKVKAAAGARALPPPESEPPGHSSVAVPPAGDQGLVVIGTSTGGPAAIASLFSSLPPLPWPVVVAQHMPEGFTRLFAERLSRTAAFPVTEARDREPLLARHAYIAPAGSHLEIARDGHHFVGLVIPRGRDDLHAPSVDRLFRSAARAAGPLVIAAVLTGMGNDGREGVVAVRKAGGRTLAESQETAVVFGMPREAAESGAVDQILALSEISVAIARLAREARREPGPPKY